MAGTPTSDQIKFGILRTRDLVELYYQGRMVVNVAENELAINGNTQTNILQQDPRRIRYEIIITAENPASTTNINIGSPAAVTGSTCELYFLAANQNIVIIRDFRSDMEGVVLPIDILGSNPGTGIVVSTRETFLTPLPVDE